MSNYTNLPSFTNKTGSVLNSFSSLSSLGEENALGSLDSVGAYSSLQDAMASLQQSSSFSTILNSAVQAAGISEETAEKLSSIASVETDNAFENEARSNLIMQNYLYAALIQESLKEQVSENGDFTSTLFQGLALGDDNSSKLAAAAIQNISIADTVSEQPSIETFV